MLLLTFVVFLAASSALPTDRSDPVVIRLAEDRYQYARSADGTPHLVDTWLKTSDLEVASRYAPDTENVYHLFTRENPSLSQPLLLGATNLLEGTNYNPARRTIIILHGWTDTVLGEANRALVPAFLEAEDVNVIAVDWNAGSGTINYIAAVFNTATSGLSVARFVNWLNLATGSTPEQYHIVGHDLGGHQAGIVGRNVNGEIAYVTALDPSFAAWFRNPNKFSATDGAYTEVMHTSAGLIGYLEPLGQVDFYPNGGLNMPGCDTPQCSHERSFYYMAESVRSGGFTGRRCATFLGAIAGQCILPGSLQMGGINPNTGFTGVYHLETNDWPPFSQD